MTAQEKNIETIRRLFAAISEGHQAEATASIATPTFIRHDLTGAVPGVEGQQGATRLIDRLKAGIPDLRLEIEDIFASGDKVAVRFVVSGTHTGEFLGHASSGKQLRISNINIYRFEDGKVAETWQLADGLGLSRQVRVD